MEGVSGYSTLPTQKEREIRDVKGARRKAQGEGGGNEFWDSRMEGERGRSTAHSQHWKMGTIEVEGTRGKTQVEGGGFCVVGCWVREGGISVYNLQYNEHRKKRTIEGTRGRHGEKEVSTFGVVGWRLEGGGV